MAKKDFVFFIFFFLALSFLARADSGDLLLPSEDSGENQAILDEEIFEAKVLEIIETERIEENKNEYIRQKIRFEALEGRREGKEFISEPTEMHALISTPYKKGDRVSVSVAKDEVGRDIFYVNDFIRRGKLYALATVFFLIILIVGRWRGFRAILGLAFSFFVILYFIIPKILSGANPLSITLIFSFLIVVIGTYLVYGLNKKSSVSILGISIGVLIVAILSVVFTNICRLAGFAQEETIFITSLTDGAIDLRGLMLAGFIIGALGVLDDLVISQVSIVQELHSLNPDLSKLEIYKRAMKVGVDHISSMVNTLFLAYAGASLPLLLLFAFNEPPFTSFQEVLNHEVIATEIVRTLVGSIGLALAVPITTFLAIHLYKKKKSPRTGHKV